MIEYALRLSRSSFARNVAVVASGTASAQAINMAFAPIITRLYGPDAYGVLGTFMALAAAIAPLAALGYPIAIVLPKEESDARAVVQLALWISIGIAVLSFLVFESAGEWILSTIGAEEIAGFALLIPLVMLFSAWMQIAQQWLIRQKAFKATARAAIVHSVVVNGAKTGAGIIHPFAAVLIGLQAVGIAIHALLLGAAVRDLPRLAETTDHSARRLLFMATLVRRYRDFPLYRAPQNLINAISQSLPVLMLAAFFGPASAGFYTLGRIVMGVPSNLLAQAVGTVFYPRITEAAQIGERQCPLIIKATLGLAALGILPFATVFAVGPWLFGFIFGPDWIPAGEYARWLSLMYFLNFINRPSVAAVPVLGLQRELLLYEVFSTGTKIAALYLGLVTYSSDKVAITLFALFGVVAYMALIVWVIIAARNADRGICHARKAG